MRRLIIVISLLGFWLSGHSKVVINEVFYDAVGSDDNQEWIELYNSSSEDINLQGWILQAGGTSYSDIFIFPSIMIRANSFFLISESTYSLSNLVTNLGFENGGSATDGIRILNPANQYTDTILYDYPNANNLIGDSVNQLPCSGVNPGQSLARSVDGVDTDSEYDWVSCSMPSPGLSNVGERKVTLQNCSVELNQTNLEVSTLIRNLSTRLVDKFELSIKIVFNNELKYYEELGAIPAEDSLSLDLTIDNEFLSSGLLVVELINNTDIQIVDNLWKKDIFYQAPALFLSEIMYHPLVNQPEWIEVKLLEDLNNADLEILDASYNEANANISGFAGEYIVIAEDKESVIMHYPNCDSLKVFQANGWARLNNTGDSVVIKCYQVTLDSLQYEASMSPLGYSLELNEVDNEWTASNAVAGATPTERNSISQDNGFNNLSGIKIVSSLISIKRDKQLKVKFNLQKIVNSIELKIFDIRGKELNSIEIGLANQYSGECSWDGCVRDKYLASGLYPTIIKLKAENGRILEEKKIIITINR